MDEGSLGTALRTIRTSRGLSLAQVGKATGISPFAALADRDGPERHHRRPADAAGVAVRDPRRGARSRAASPGRDRARRRPAGAALRATSRRPTSSSRTWSKDGVRTEFADGREIELAAGDSATYVSGDGGHRGARR